MAFSKKDWFAQPIEHKDAIDFVEQNHYAKGGSNTGRAFGLFYKGDHQTIHGVSLWQPPPLGASKSVCGENHRIVTSLSRFCLSEDLETNAGSFFIAKSIKMLDRKWMVCLTYADTFKDHEGILYQAGNWDYLGLMRKQPVFINRETGQQVSRKKGKKSYTIKEMDELFNCELAGYSRKHKFAFTRNRKNYGENIRTEQPGLFFDKNGRIILNDS